MNNLNRMEKINLNKIRGRWQGLNENGNTAGGDDTVKSIKLVAEKVNEIIDSLNKKANS